MLASSPPQQPQQQVSSSTSASASSPSPSSGTLSGGDELLKHFASKLSTLNIPTSLEATSSEDKSSIPINKIAFDDLEKEFSDIVGKLLSNEDACKKVDSFLLDLFTSSNDGSSSTTQSSSDHHELYENYIRVAYYLYLLSSTTTASTDGKKNVFDLILLQHVPICIYIYFQTKNNSKLDDLQQLFLSKVESVLLLIYNNESIKRREMPINEKTLSFIGSQINAGIKTRYNSSTSTSGVSGGNEKITTPVSSKLDLSASNNMSSLLLGSSHANEDFYTGISSKTLYIRSELLKNQESISPLFFKDYENTLPIASEVNDRILGIVCQTFAKRLDVLPLNSIFTFVRVVQKLVSQKVPYRIPTLDQVEIIKTRNEQARKIMEESLKVIKEDIIHEAAVAAQSSTTTTEEEEVAPPESTTMVTSESDVQLDVETPTSTTKKKKMYYHEYLTQLDLITMYTEQYGDVEESPSGASDEPHTIIEPKNASMIPLSENFINETLAVLKYTSHGLDKLSEQPAPKDLFGSKQTSSKAIIVESLYALYLRLIFDYIDSMSLLQVQSMLKMLD